MTRALPGDPARADERRAASADAAGPGHRRSGLAPGGSVRAAASGWRQPGSLAHACRLGDDAGMARDDGRAQLRRVALMSVLDGARPSGTVEWVSAVVPGMTQAAVGAGHWAAGRRRRALAAWASAAGSGLVVWALGTEAPTRAEAQQNVERHEGPVARAWDRGAGCRRAAHGPAAIAGRRY